MSKIKILLTGATGFIGTNFVLRLHQKYEIIALVRPTSNTNKIEKYCEIYRYDDDFKCLENLFNEKKFDGVVHIAALAPTAANPNNNIDDLINSNITFGTRLLEASKEKIKFFINTSSSFNYCNCTTYRPASLYAASKKAFEDIMTYYALDNDEIVYTNLLFFNAYGPNDKANSTRLFSLLDKVAKSGEVLQMTDGTQIVDYSHVFDVVAGFDILIELCLKEPEFAKNKVFSLKGGERMSLKNLVLFYEKATNQKLNIAWGAKVKRKFEILNPWQAGEKLPNWQAQISLKQGFKALFNDTTGGGDLTNAKS